MRCRSIGVAIAITVAVFGPAAVAGRPDGFGGRVRGHVEALAALGSRMGGGANEARAAEYIAGEFRRLGLPAAIETFAFESFEPSSIELRVGDRTIDPVGLGLDPYAGDPGYAGTFVLLDPRIPGSELEPSDVAGKAVVVPEGGDPSAHFRIAALGSRVIVVLSRADFGTVGSTAGREMTLSIRGGRTGATSRNVIARLGADRPEFRILVGAHLDAYRNAPGASDNASGVAALLELARSMREAGLPEGMGVTFVAFGAEEIGLVGSRSHVARHAGELRKCALALVLDDVGGTGPVLVERNGGERQPRRSPSADGVPEPYRDRSWEGLRYPWRLLPPAALLSAFGSPYHPDWLVDAIDVAVRETGFEVRFTGPAGSDQAAFAMAGVPTTGISSPSAWSHSPDDRAATVDLGTVERCMETAARIIRKVRERRGIGLDTRGVIYNISAG